MKTNRTQIDNNLTHNVFGPVPSRRLGRSIGINNIPPKICTYGCIYCQVGRTTHFTVHRQPFYDPNELLDLVREKVNYFEWAGESIDALTIVPDGEPTLDSQLGALIYGLKKFDIPVAVITNASLLWMPSVRNDLLAADWVSLKIDAVSETLWRKINHPTRDLSFQAVLEGMNIFAREFGGTLMTESMFIQGLNEHLSHARVLAEFIAQVNPRIAYIAVPTRPPAVGSIQAADGETLTRIFHLFETAGLDAEYLIGYEGNAFSSTGDAKNDLLSITAVHPMRHDAVEALLRRNKASWRVVDDLVTEKQLLKIKFDNFVYYARQSRT